MDSALSVKTIEEYERRVEEIEAERKRNSTMERFERRIEEIEAEIAPQLNEIRALKAGLHRLRQAAGGGPAVTSDSANSRSHVTAAKSPAGQTPPARRRR